MTKDHDLEHRVGDALGRRSDDVHGSPFTFDDIRGRARTIRRRRRTAVAAGAAAAVLAVLIPVATLTAGGDGREVQPAPAPAPAHLAEKNADGSYRLTADAPRGEAPDVPYLVLRSRSLVTPDDSFDLGDDYQEITPYGDGWLALRAATPKSGLEVVELTSGFDEVGSAPAAESIVVSDDGSRLGWIENPGDDAELVVAGRDGAERSRTPVTGDELLPVGFLPDGGVLYVSSDRDTAEQSAGIVDGRGDVTPAPGFQYVHGTSEATGLLGGQTDYRKGVQCGGVVDPARGADPLWQSCDYVVLSFSPDGRYVVGTHTSIEDGPGASGLAILDATSGLPVAEFAPAPADKSPIMIQRVVWEDDQTVLATASSGRKETILRLGAEGTLERTTDDFPVEPMSFGIFFAEQPYGTQ